MFVKLCAKRSGSLYALANVVQTFARALAGDYLVTR